MPILRALGHGGDVTQLTDNVSSKRLRNLGEKMGYPETVTWYWLRRLVLNAVDGWCGYAQQSQSHLAYSQSRLRFGRSAESSGRLFGQSYVQEQLLRPAHRLGRHESYQGSRKRRGAHT